MCNETNKMATSHGGRDTTASSFVRRASIVVVLMLFVVASQHVNLNQDKGTYSSIQDKQITIRHFENNSLENKTIFSGPHAHVLNRLQEEYPECILEDGVLRVRQFGRYVHRPGDPWQTQYDHVSCFVMKARYNW